MNIFFFSIYPYIALTIFLLGSLVRFDREQYGWKADSSQLLQPKYLRVGNILFHLGILGLFAGHFVGLLTPVIVWDTLGVSHSAKQLLAMTAGGIMGTMALVGLLMLIYRRFSSPRLLRNSSWRDKLVLIWILLTLLLGLATIFVSSTHLDGDEMLKLMKWAQHIVTFRGGASEYMVGASLIFKLHMIMGMTLFIIFPFTRLVHIWSGFGTLVFLNRTPQLVRRKSSR
ncbi:respiratory nitrate reductase subunit gamma [Ignatzschineria rhizosphaerae]|uniref:Respiratory nitrate reductase subunit gamma n=1 Tax=Ignatzschineria rhizosphaerae TaxID=2923279 RepID=A0ABY3X2P1_9GAMM|nr:respiratory nitrate reductase subunit gamma [Ignatzschineria rhizosphaerae]UNM97136.1 respiratory nitrate reductase subunit gamma [Ignatzschineria rhizosphaerae]